MALVTVAAVVLVACSDDNQDAGGEVARYCELVHQLEDAGEEAFLEEHQDDFDAIEVVAPDEIQDDVATLLTVQRAGEVTQPAETATSSRRPSSGSWRSTRSTAPANEVAGAGMRRG